MAKYHPNEEVSLWISKLFASKHFIKQDSAETYLSPLNHLTQPEKPEKIIRKAWVDEEDVLGYLRQNKGL